MERRLSGYAIGALGLILGLVVGLISVVDEDPRNLEPVTLQYAAILSGLVICMVGLVAIALTDEVRGTKGDQSGDQPET